MSGYWKPSKTSIRGFTCLEFKQVGERHLREADLSKKCSFFEHCSNGGEGGQPMFKNYVGNCRVFWRSFNNMKFAWKGTFEALMVKFEGKIGTLYQIFTPCTHCKFCMMFKRKGGGSKAFWTILKKMHFSYTMASLNWFSLTLGASEQKN